MDNKKVIDEIERLRAMSAEGQLLPTDFDNLMVMVGGTTWAKEIGEE